MAYYGHYVGRLHLF